MTRQADVHSKLKTLVFKAKFPEDELKVQAVKKLCIQDDLEIYDFLNESIDLGLLKHNCPVKPNPQLTLDNCEIDHIVLGKCSMVKCQAKAFKEGVNLQTGLESRFCKRHFEELPLRWDNKLWKWKT